jgi:hypothetical protein
LNAHAFIGNGTQDNPYLIFTNDDWKLLSNSVLDDTFNSSNNFFALQNNLIGINYSIEKFCGHFDGNGYVIELKGAPNGVFKWLKNATIQNLGVTGTINILSSDCEGGGICGRAESSTIKNCYNSANISIPSSTWERLNIGGICGLMQEGTISDCHNVGDILGIDVTTTSYQPANIGGICGQLYTGKISNSYSTGDIDLYFLAGHWAGARGVAAFICGLNGGTVENCFVGGDPDPMMATNSCDEGVIVAKNTNGGQYNNCYLSELRGDVQWYIYYDPGAPEETSSHAQRFSSVNATDDQFKSEKFVKETLQWDVAEVWKTGSARNGGLPMLRWMEPEITAKVEGGGSISPADYVNKVVEHGSDHTLVFTPQSNYLINKLTINSEEQAEAKGKTTYTYNFKVVSGIYNIVVSYYLPSYSITTSIVGNTGGTVTSSDTRPHGTNMTIEIMPKNGYEIDEVKIDGVVNEAAKKTESYTFTNITANHEILVTFKQWSQEFTITASAGSGGSISPGDTIVTYGNPVTYTFTPATNYEIAEVKIDGNENAKAKADGVYTFSNIDDGHSIEVTFQRTYRITASASAGGVISPAGDATVSEGVKITYIITPVTGYEIETVLIDGKTDENAKNNKSHTFSNISGNHSIVVTFKQIQYKINLTASNGGSIIKVVSDGVDTLVNHGEIVEYVFLPDTGYEISLVEIDGEQNAEAKADGSYIFHGVTATHSISVQYSLKWHTISAESTKDGSIDPTGSAMFTSGSSKTYSFEPNDDYEISAVLIDGVENEQAKKDKYYTFTNIFEGHTIQVIFSRKVTTEINGSGGYIKILVSNNGNRTFVFTPDNGFEIETVLIDGVPNANAQTNGFFEVTANETYNIEVTFKPAEHSASGLIQVRDVRTSAYPNPTSGIVTVKSPTLKAGDKITVCNAAGAVISRYTATALETALDISPLPAGVYFVNVNGKQVKVVKF